MDTANRVQILDEDVCISYSALGKGVNPTILPRSIGKKVEQTVYSTLVWKPIQEKEN